MGVARRLRQTKGPGVRIPEQTGTEEVMSSVDLARVGACVLKHAVTGEVRPGLRRTEKTF